jgi:trehalose/maltose hydrolase-like predicted phosphorylase
MCGHKIEMTASTLALGNTNGGSGALARRFEAVVFDWDATADMDQQPDLARIRTLVEQASFHGLELAISSSAGVCNVDGRLAARPAGPGGLILAVNRGSELFSVDREGPHLVLGTDAPAREDMALPSAITRWLWRRGIPGAQVLFASGELDPDALIAVLEDQISRRRRGELPVVVEDPDWVLAIDGADRVLERVHESLLTLADGRLGTRGSEVTRHVGREPAVLMSGVYARAGAETHLLDAPRWNEIASEQERGGSVRRTLDLHAGVLHQQTRSEHGALDALLFSSLARPGTPILRGRGTIVAARLAGSLEPPPAARYEEGEEDGLVWMRVTGQPASIAAAADCDLHGREGAYVLDRIAAYEGTSEGVADHRAALDRVREARKVGFDGLLAEHRRAWASRWEDADVQIEGDQELQLAVRFALFHLMASVPDDGEAAVGARGLTGSAYRGHVFWDSDVYVLPFLAATHPQAARAMLEYRIRRLPAALRAARARGRSGARFPWESARSGQDVTPNRVRDHRGELVRVLTGELEEHVVADVAWAAGCYVDWTGDQAFAGGPGRELLVQTARWWASRVEPDEQGCGHIRGVIGPDEYHERVDDNAYTNGMARWNLRRAADAARGAVDEGERRRWLELAEMIVDGYNPATGVYEQFAGFHQLEPLLITDVAPQRPVAADLLLGHDRTRHAQVVKQADVLMLHYLVPDEVKPGSLEANLDFYDPRTAHGSTLSPGVHAALLSRAHRLQQALATLRLTARVDLDDIGHMTAGGLHLAAMGSVWRALTYGFAGLRPAADALAIDPVLPSCWEALELRVRFRGSRVRARIREREVQLTADPPVQILSPAGERLDLFRRPRTFELTQRSPRRS